MYKTIIELCSQLQVQLHDKYDSYSENGKLIFKWIAKSLIYNTTGNNKSLFSKLVKTMYLLVDKKNINMPTVDENLLLALERIIFQSTNPKKTISQVNFFELDPLEKFKEEFRNSLESQLSVINDNLMPQILALVKSTRFEVSFGLGFQNEILNFLKRQINNAYLSLEKLSHNITLDQLEDAIALILTGEGIINTLHPDEIDCLKRIMQCLAVTRPNGITAYKKQLQRKIIYRQLDNKLQETEIAFQLVCPVNNALDPFLVEDYGFCHGYSIFWLDNMLHGKSAKLTNGFDWQQLISDDYYKVQGIPLSEEIINLQQQEKSSATQSLRYVNAFKPESFEKLTETIATILSIKGKVNKAYLVNMRVKPEESALPFPLRFASAYFPQLIHEWHEISCYQDDKHYIHWFDSNIGWFKSNYPTPDIEQFANFLASIFHVCQYKKKYDTACIVEIQMQNGKYSCHTLMNDPDFKDFSREFPIMK